MTGRQSTIDPQRHFHEQDPKGPLKAKLRIAATVFAFVGTIMFSYAAAKTLHLNNPYFVVVDGAFQDELPLAPSLLSLLYNPFSVILLIHVREGRRIHPGWHIVIDFIIWGLCIPSITFAARDGWWIWWTPFNPEFDYDGIYGCAEENFFSEKCSPLIYTIGRMEITGCVCLFFIWALHLTLFTLSCIDLYKLKKSSNNNPRHHHLSLHKDQHRTESPDRLLFPSPPPSYSSLSRKERGGKRDLEKGKKGGCPDCNLPGLGCCE